MRILFSPIHYILDKHHSGSEFSWSYNLFELLSKSTAVKTHFITGGTRGMTASQLKRIHDCRIIDPENINLSLLNVLRFYVSSTIATAWYMLTHRVDILHHVLPFRIGYSFNLNGIFTRKKFIVGPIQSSLSVLDTDLSAKDARGFEQSKHDVIDIVGKKLITIFQMIFGLLSHLTLRNASVIIVINEFTKSLLVERGYSAEKIVIIPPGIHTQSFKNNNSRARETINCITCSYLLKRKNVDFLLKVMAEVKKLNKNIKLTIVGDGPQKDTLQKLSKDLGLEDTVTFTGFITQDKISSYYQKSDIYLNASSAEGFATVALEAVAAGLSIVSSKVGGFESVVRNEKNGYIIDSIDIDMFSKRILEISTDNSVRLDMKKVSREIALNEYDWATVIIPKYLTIYEGN